MSTFWRFFYHLVWATKDRAPTVDEVVARAVLQSFEVTATDLDVVPHAWSVMPDHVHLALSIPPRLAVADVAKRLKGESSYAANSPRHPQLAKFAWQPGYGSLTFGEGSLPRVVAYIENQYQHHADRTLWPIFECVDDERPILMDAGTDHR